MRARLLGVAKYFLYPLFYVVCLLVGVYMSFPWDRVQDRLEAEFAKTQASKGAEAWKLEITSLDGYWLSGVEMSGTKIIIPPDAEEEAESKTGVGAPGAKGPLAKAVPKKPIKDGEDPISGDAPADAKDTASKDADKDAKDTKAPPKPRESVIMIEHAHARVQLAYLLIGRVRVNFGADVFGGNIHGSIPIGGGDLSIEMENIDLGQIAPLSNLASVPVKGVANGKLELTSQGKWSKAAGTFNLTVTDMVMGDGKAKFRNLMPLPPANLGTFEIEGKADAGVLKIEKFGATGRDLEIIGEGTIKLREPWDASVADLWVRFGFSDDYKNTDDRTKALFVDDPPFPALISQDRKLKRAKRPDGMWGFHVHGKLGRLRYDPTAKDGPKGSKPAADSKKTDKDDDDDDLAAAPTSKSPAKRPASPPRPATPSPRNTAQPVDVPQPEGREEPTPAPAPAPVLPDQGAPDPGQGAEPPPEHHEGPGEGVQEDVPPNAPR
ncbi:MAG: type II secretion system protein GspN [Polyangiaceae bacterium]|nr:type II secretion system protein GspN [Polyangiaceae bacterium]